MVHASPAPAAPLWLSRERDVISHLFYAAAEIGGAVVELGGQPIEGVLAMPDPKAGTFAFFLAEGQAPRAAPTAGAVVRVSYLQGEAAYAFLTVIAETDGHRRWELRFPRSVERSERRGDERRKVFGRPGWSFQQREPLVRLLSLYDVSTTGVGLIAARADRLLRPGATVTGAVMVPSGEGAPLRLEVRHARSLPGDPSAVIVGCKVAEMPAEALLTLRAALARTPPLGD